MAMPQHQCCLQADEHQKQHLNNPHPFSFPFVIHHSQIKAALQGELSDTKIGHFYYNTPNLLG
ncbi:hypothetical protein P7K49_034635, partial [Saguinus oedipus]